MKLIAILIALALEYFLGSLDRLRDFRWFDRYGSVLELRLGRRALWDGPAGVVFTLLWPLLLLLLLAHVLGRVSVLLVFFLGIAVFVYCLGPDMNTLLHRYAGLLRAEDGGDRQELEQALGIEGEADTGAALRALLLRAHDNLFAILFWFVLLGMAGALLYRLVVLLERRYTGIHGAYAEAVRNLHLILMWPSARLLLLAFGLGGSLMHALESWRGVHGHSLDCSPAVIGEGGLGALQYPGEAGAGAGAEQRAGWIDEARGLVNRTLIVWLTGLGILTIGGFLH